MIQTTAQAIKFLKGVGFSVRVARMEEKRVLAREAKTKAHARRRYCSDEARDIHSNFCKVCYAVWIRGFFNGFYGPRSLIELAKAFAFTDFHKRVDFPSFRGDKAKYKSYHHKAARRDDKEIIRESLNEMYNVEQEQIKEDNALLSHIFGESFYDASEMDYLTGCYPQDESDYDRADYLC